MNETKELVHADKKSSITLYNIRGYANEAQLYKGGWDVIDHLPDGMIITLVDGCAFVVIKSQWVAIKK